MTNVVNFPIIPRPEPQDDVDPHTAAIRKIREAIQFAVNRCGKGWTFGVLRAAMEIDGSGTDWRRKGRGMFSSKGDK